MVKTVTGEEVTLEELGGATSHASKSGVATFISESEEEILDSVKTLLSFLPSNNMESRQLLKQLTILKGYALNCQRLCLRAQISLYDMRQIIESILDDGNFMEYFPSWAQSIVCGFGHLDGKVVGVVGNQPLVLAGVLDIESSSKAARFVRTCDAFNIPLLTLVDVPGFLPGVDQEYGGIIRHGAKLLYAYCEATVPRIQVITRKAYGGAYVVMDSKSVGSDISFAWPTAELAVMGPQGAVEIIHRREIQSAADPEERKNELVDDYTERFANPYIAAERGYIDDVINPADTRKKVIAGFAALQKKREDLPQRKTRSHTPLGRQCPRNHKYELLFVRNQQNQKDRRSSLPCTSYGRKNLLKNYQQNGDLVDVGGQNKHIGR